ACSRCTTAGSRRRSTTSTRIRSATSTTCRTRRATRRSRSRSRTRWALAATTAASSSAASTSCSARLRSQWPDTVGGPRCVRPLEGRFLELLVRLTRARRVLELGTFTGWSSIAMASGLPPDGRIVTCDVDPEAQEIARRYADEAGVADRIDYRLGPALETIRTLEGPLDLVFIDADKEGYLDYY